MNIKDKIGKKLLFFDGGMGSMLQKKGLKTGELPEILNITNSDIIIDIHKQYLCAGADIITANTFGAYNLKYNNLKEIIKASLNNCKEAIKSLNLNDRYIALDMGPTGKLLKPLGELEFEECYEIFKETALYGEKYGADLIIIETISDIYEAKAAVLACKENTSLPIICTMTFDENGKALTGADILTMVSVLEGLKVDALGINCGLGPKQAKNLFSDLIKYSSAPVIMQPNAGLPHVKDGETFYDVNSEEYSEYMAEFAESGAWILGGCCGTTPEHIKKTIDKCINITPPQIENKNITVLSSYSKSVIIDEKPIIIGERINPTGKKKFKEALKLNNMQYILNEAINQIEHGADVLDVNVGLPEINEEKLMLKTIKTIQEITDTPIQIDSSTPEVIEKALRIYNGKALINSVNGKTEIMEKIFPLAAKYGGIVVGLTLDEKGIPKTAEERFKIAEKIINTAEKYGINKKDIIIDALTLTVSAQQEESKETIKAIKLIKDNLKVKTVLGISNISFGLPNRTLINTTFLALALNSGLSACIINPLSKPMTDTINAYNVLSGIDKGCNEYVDKYKKEVSLTIEDSEKQSSTLKDLIIKGIKDNSYEETKKLLNSLPPIDIINLYIIPALDIVGSGYEKGTLFLPQLIMSAETAKSAFKAIQNFMSESGTEEEKKGTIVIATVQGDIHDIGKNIVKALLENYGFNVIDLGKDVPIQKVVETVVKNNVKLVGLSALMTTTVVNMEKTIIELKKADHSCKVMVGGAVLNEEYAKMIGADFYGKDALASVSYAQKIFK